MAIMMKGPHARSEHDWLHPARRNVGGWERGARLFLGAASLGAAAATGSLWLAVPLALIGAGGLVTSVGAYCPINRRLGHDSYHHHELR